MSPPTDSGVRGEPIPFARPSITDAETEAVVRVLRSGWLTTGGECAAFEQEFAATVGSRHAKAVNSATAGLHLGLEALGVGPGDSVVTTPYTFTATAEVARYLGAEVVFADIAVEGFNLDPAQVERVLSHARHRNPRPREDSAPKVIIPVHIGGFPCRMDELIDIGARYECAIMEDAAHAFPVPTEAGYLGAVSDVGVFSFYANKTITTGEGGMLVTDSDEVASRVSVMRNHGIDRDAWDRYTRTGASWEYGVVAPGFKYNMPDTAAALGRVQLKRASELLRKRKERAHQYVELLEDRDYLQLPPHSGPNAWHLFIITLIPGKISISRDEVIRRLAQRGIGTSVHYIPLHMMPYYRTRYDLVPEDFPNSLYRYRNSVSLPLFPDMTSEQVERVAGAVRDICETNLRLSTY